MPTFEKGPIERLDVEAVLAGDLAYDFAQTANEGLSDVEGLDARIGAAHDAMRADLDANDPASLEAAIDAADYAHERKQAAEFEPSIAEVAAADAERLQLVELGAVLPAEGTPATRIETQRSAEGIQAIDVDWDALAGLPGYLDRQLADFRARLEELGKVPVGFNPGPRPSPGPSPTPGPTERPPGPEPHPPIDLPPPIVDNPDDHGGIKPPPDGGSDGTTPSGGEESPLAGKFEE